VRIFTGVRPKMPSGDAALCEHVNSRDQHIWGKREKNLVSCGAWFCAGHYLRICPVARLWARRERRCIGRAAKPHAQTTCQTTFSKVSANLNLNPKPHAKQQTACQTTFSKVSASVAEEEEEEEELFVFNDTMWCSLHHVLDAPNPTFQTFSTARVSIPNVAHHHPI